MTKRTEISRTDSPKGTKLRHRRGLGWRILRTVLVVLTVLVGLGLFVSAYAGCIDPTKTRGYSGIAQMTLPLWIIAMAVMAALCFMLCRKGLWLVLLFTLASIGPILDFMPMHITNIDGGRLKDKDKDRAFTLLTYNVQNLWVEPGARLANGDNATIKYIMETDADIVCLQEGRYIPSTVNPTPVTPAQKRELHRRYPYVYMSAGTQLILSKYPVQPIRLDFPNEGKGLGLITAYRLNVEGTPITIFNVHLRSIGLNSSDKLLFRELTQNQVAPDSMRQVRTRLLGKLAKANVARAKQVDRLARYINHLGGPNVIVCGDFNDVPGSYSLRRLEEVGMHQVYPEVCFGPRITYYQDRFFFRIDHVLYRGAMRPVAMKRPRVRFSDHYPLLTTFVLTGKQQPEE